MANVEDPKDPVYDEAEFDYEDYVWRGQDENCRIEYESCIDTFLFIHYDEAWTFDKDVIWPHLKKIAKCLEEST